ncbi:hypothetical protein [Luteimonas sp. R10]|uniref:hypothetical protein n=1 Tax=Luteimonas sp. R10 TaxID=3108176 RepID=UPI003093040F|nr:hypothetical protein U3649_11770 [Luteimonas sp. R10]
MSGSKPPPRRRIGTGMIVLAIVVACLLGLQFYRGHQLRASCEDGGGGWDPDLQQCTFGRPDGRVPSPPESQPQ